MDKLTELGASAFEAAEPLQTLRTMLAFVVLFFGAALTIAAAPLLLMQLLSIGFA